MFIMMNRLVATNPPQEYGLRETDKIPQNPWPQLLP